MATTVQATPPWPLLTQIFSYFTPLGSHSNHQENQAQPPTGEGLPVNVFTHALAFLSPHDLSKSCQVSRKWNRLSNAPIAWIGNAKAEVAKTQFNEKELKVSNPKAFLKEFRAQHLKSNDEIISRLQAFINKIELGQNGQFRCQIGPNPNSLRYLSVEIKGSTDPIRTIGTGLQVKQADVNDYHLKDFCIATNGIGNGDLTNFNSSRDAPRMRYFVNCSKSQKTCTTIRASGCVQAILRYPYFTGGLIYYTQLSDKIESMLERKIEQLNKQRCGNFIVVWLLVTTISVLATYIFSLPIWIGMAVPYFTGWHLLCRYAFLMY